MKQRRFIATLLALVMVITLMPVGGLTTAKAGIGATSGITFDSDSTKNVTGYQGDKSSVTRIVIPEDAKSVKTGAFYSNEYPNLKEITVLGDSTAIENNAFGVDNTGTTDSNLVVWCNKGSAAEAYAQGKGLTRQYLNATDMKIDSPTTTYYSGHGSFVISTKVAAKDKDVISKDVIWSVDETSFNNGIIWFQEGDKKVSSTQGILTENEDGTVTSRVYVYVIATASMKDLTTTATVTASCRGNAKADSVKYTINRARDAITPAYKVFKPKKVSDSKNNTYYSVSSYDKSTGAVTFDTELVKEGYLKPEETALYIDQGCIVMMYDKNEEDAYGKTDMDIIGQASSTGGSIDSLAEVKFSAGTMMCNGETVKMDGGVQPIVNAITCDGKTYASYMNNLLYAIKNIQSPDNITLVSQNKTLTRKVDIGVCIPAEDMDIYMSGAKVNGTILVIEKQTAYLEAKFDPNNSTDSYEWTSSDTEVVSVTGNTLSMIRPGNATITCNILPSPAGERTLKKSFNLVVVEKVPYKQIVFAKDETKKDTITDYYLETEKTYKPLVCDARDGKIYVAKDEETAANEPLIYSSSDKSIATVDSDGNITAGKKPGVVKITVTASEHPEVSSSLTVHVYAKANAIDVQPTSNVVCGQETYIPYTFDPTTASEDVKWLAQNEDVVTVEDYVDEKGEIGEAGRRYIKVLGLKEGSTSVEGTTIPSGAFTRCSIIVQPAIHVDKITLNAEAEDGAYYQATDSDGNVTYNLVKGKSILLEPILTSDTGKVPNDKMRWEIESGQDVANVTVGNDGTLNVKSTKTGKFLATLVAYGYNTDEQGKLVEVNKKVSFYLNVYVPAESVKIVASNRTSDVVNLECGSTMTMYGQITPTDCLEKITWTTDNDNISLTRNVTENGSKDTITVSADKVGTTVVTATTDSGKKTTLTINVIKSAKSISFIRNGEKVSSVSVVKGGQTEVSLEVLDPDTTDTEFTWSKSNVGDYVEIVPSEDGKKAIIKGVMQGQQTIQVTAKSSRKSASLTVNVLIPADSISLNNTEFNIYKGDAGIKLEASLSPSSNYSDIVKWTTDKEDIVQIIKDSRDTKVITVKGINAGTVVITGTTLSGKSASATVNVTTKNLANQGAVVNDITAQNYNGKECAPNVVVKIDNKTLVKNKDYTVEYVNNVNAGTAKAIIHGIGVYDGDIEKEFTINPKAIPAAKSISGIEYTGKAQEPEVVIVDYGKNLVEGVDYTVSYENNVKAGSATITIKGIGNYTSERKTAFRISKKDISSSEDIVIGAIKNYTYTGARIEPAVTVKDGAVVLKKDVDYRVSYMNNTNAGVAKVTITGLGNYQGTKVTEFKINPKSIATAKIAAIPSRAYTGKAQVASIQLTIGGKQISSSYYTVTYSANKNPGKAIITVKGKGNYTSSVKGSFIIYPIAPASAKMSKCTTSTVKLSWAKAVGATGYTVYVRSGSKYKKVGSTTKNYYTVSKLSAGKDYQYKIHAYVKVGNKYYYSTKFVTTNAGTLPKKVTLSSVKSTYRKTAIVKFKKVTGATNYTVYYATSKNGKYKLASTTTSNSVKVSGLKGGKKYYFKVRATKKINGKTYKAAFSSVKSVKIKK